MIQVLYAGNPKDWPNYQAPLEAAFEKAGLKVELTPDNDDPTRFDYMIYAPNSPVQDFTPFTGLKAVLNMWAGVEAFLDNSTLNVPLARMVESGMTEGMAEWVLGHVMRHHLGMDAHILGQDGHWRNDVTPPLARERTVGILGLGELGQASARLLHGIGFNLLGWSRNQKEVPGVTCHSGPSGLKQVLAHSDTLVLLLPLTPDTKNLINADALALMPKGSTIINPGRGPLIDDDALISGLKNGRISHATLDVFRTEPLPADHPYWASPNVTVTPHIASATRISTAAETIAENIRRGEAGEPFLHLVDRKQGY